MNSILTFIGVAFEIMGSNALNEIIGSFTSLRIANIEKEAITDPLTGLYNRRYIHEFKMLHSEKNLAVNWCVAMLDIDDFKNVNDKYGHAAGDIVLQELAKMLKGNLRSADIIFRWGGEEFLIFLEGVTLSVAYNILEKTRNIIEQTVIDTGNTLINITVTIGASILNLNDIEANIADSDKKMYYGKKTEKNKVVI